jgi:addiction module HigA family antidote
MSEAESPLDRLPNIHPGEVLREDYLQPLGKSKYWLAKGLGISPTAVGEILAGKRSITPATALRLSRFFGASAQFWLNLQARYDLEEAEQALKEDLDKIERFHQAAA